MKDLSAMPAATAQNLIGVAFDVDDTVTRGGTLELASFSALWRLRESGLHAVACTGRPLGWADLFAQLWPIDCAVGENGGGWTYLREGHLIRSHPATQEERVAQRTLIESVTQRIGKEMPDLRPARDNDARRADWAYDIGEECQVPVVERDRLVKLIESMGAKAPYSSVHCHIVPGTWDKATGLRLALKEVLGLEPSEVRERFVFVGDSKNDEAAFDFFAHSVGVRNIERHQSDLTVLPKYITKQAYGAGFAEVVDWVLEHRASPDSK